MNHRLSDEALDVLFRKARTHHAWLDKPVSDDVLRELYELMKWGPTSANCCPARILFLRSREAKERLRPALSPGNIDHTMASPVIAIIGYNTRFCEKLPTLFPHNPNAREWFETSPELAELSALRNGTLQGAYFIIAARSLGLDCGPMCGFDNNKVDAEFFSHQVNAGKSDQGSMTDSCLRSNFLCNLGYGDHSKLFPRNPRLDFDETCKLL
jgi:3-hydroxypropanoate dehydrogenase